MDNSAAQQTPPPQPPTPQMPSGPQPPQSKNHTVAIIVICAVAFVLFVVGGTVATWLIISSSRADNRATSTSSMTPDSTNNSTNNDTQTTDQTPGFVTISEFGVKYKKTDAQKNLSYKITESATPSIRYALFSSSVAGSKCSAKLEIGKIVQTDFEMSADSLATAQTTQVKIGNYWYMYGYPTKPTCTALTSDPTLKAQYDAEVALLKNEIFTSLELK